MNSIESLQNRGKGAAVTRKHGYKINTASIEAQHAAEEMMLQIENDMKNASAKLAAEQAERMVKDSIAASMERIKNENESMRTWEENMVRRSGYTVDGKNIYRDAVVDSTIGKTYYEGQSVHYYEDFYNAGPTVSVSLSKTMLDGLNSSTIMLLVEQANYDIENWSKQVFGNTEKDDEGNVVLKQNAVVRDSFYNDDVDRFKTLSKKDYDKLSDSERKELNGLSTGIVSVRDGALGEWTGYAPVFKDGNSGLDLSNSRESNIKYQGSGQMGQIMLDFQWNCMIEQQGWQKVALPAYDQPLWRGNGSWFEPPTIRGVASIVFEIVGQASSQTWFSYADDVIFAAIDLGGGFKSPEQVGLDLAKTAATAVISMGCSSAGSAVGKVADASLKGAGKVLAKAGISAATSYVTTVGNSFVNNWNLDANGNLKFDADNFGKSTYSAQTIAGSVGAGVTSGLTTAANMKMQKMGDNGAAVNKFYGTAVNAGISAAGKLSEYAVYSAYALAEGRTLADAYDDMGGLTFNIGSLGMFADMMATGIARNNATGQAGKFGEIAQKLEGKGILEINIGSNGIKGKFGMGGFDLVGSLYTFGKRMSDKAALEAYAMQERVSKEEAEAAYWGYVYGDWTQENTMARISSRRDELHIVDDMADDANAQTVQKADGSGRVITMKNTGDYHTNAVTLGHESYRDGIVSNKADQQRETFNAVVGHAGMAARMDDYGTHFDGLLGAEVEAYKKGDMTALMMDSLYNYSSDADYWKIVMNADGSHNFLFDGKKTLSIDYMDEDGNLISTSEPDIKTQNEMVKGVGMAESLTKVLGKERVLELLKQNSIDVKSVNDIPDNVLASVLGITEDTVKVMPDPVKAQVFESKKDAMIGELLMNKMGASWDPNAKNVNGGKGSWVNTDGINLTITDSTYNGNIMAEISNGKYLYSTVNATLYRDPDSWKSIVGTPDIDDPTNEKKVTWKNNDKYSNLDVRVFTKTGINWECNEEPYVEKGIQSIDNMYESVSHPEKSSDYNQAYYDNTNKRWVQGNTIISEYYNMQYFTTSRSYEGNVLIKNNAWTIDGNWVGNEGKDTRSDDRWLAHANRLNGASQDWNTTRSDGCDIESYANQMAMLEKLKSWKLTNGYQIRTHLVNQKYGGQ